MWMSALVTRSRILSFASLSPVPQPREGEVGQLVRLLVLLTRDPLEPESRELPRELLRVEILLAVIPALELPLARHLVDEQRGVREDGYLFVAMRLEVLKRPY